MEQFLYERISWLIVIRTFWIFNPSLPHKTASSGYGIFINIFQQSFISLRSK